MVSARKARGGPQHIPRPPTARPGAPSPWLEGINIPSLDEICDRVALHTPGIQMTGAPPQRSESAVLVPLFEHDGEPHVVLTTRSSKLRSHSGEVSFPGGRRDPGESLFETALREATEEVALPPACVELVGELDRLATMSSGSSIHPYVGRIERLPDLEPNPSEVDRILYVSLAELVAPGVFREERWSGGPFAHERPIWFFELWGDTVWGATASMLRQLLVISLLD